MEPLVGRAAGAREPRSRGRLVVEARRIGFNAKERDEIVVVANTEFACGLERAPQAFGERPVVAELRVLSDEVLAHAGHEPSGVDLGKPCYLFGGQLKHGDAPFSVHR